MNTIRRWLERSWTKNKILKVSNNELLESNNLLKMKENEQTTTGPTYAQITGKRVNKTK